MQVDLELALTNPGDIEVHFIQERLPEDFYAEDRSKKGWGLVIRTSRELPDDEASAVDFFLSQLCPLADLIKKTTAIFRVGAFHNTVTCTVHFKSCADLVAMGASLEISTYPCSDEEPGERDMQ